MTLNRYDLRPLDYSGILDRTIELYRNNFVIFFAISAMVYLPLSLVQLGMTKLVQGGGAPDPEKVLAMMAPLMAVNFLVALFSIFATGAITIVIGNRYLGYPITIGQAWAAVFREAVPLLMTTLLSGLLIMVGMVMCVIPGIVFAFWVAFITQVVLLERIRYWQAIERSKQLISGGQWVRVLVLGILMFILGAVLGTVVSVAGSLLGGHGVATYAQVALQGVLQAVLFPLGMIAQTLLYYDIRVRREAFDLQMLAGSFGVTLQGDYAPQGGYGQQQAYPQQQGYGQQQAYGQQAYPAAPPPPTFGQEPPPPYAPPPPAAGAWPQGSNDAPGAYGEPPPPSSSLPPTQSFGMRYCTGCGGQIPGDTRFCTHCGQAQS